MDNKHKGFMDFAAKVLLLSEGVVFGIVCMLMYSYFTKIGAIVLVVLCIVITASMYIVLRRRFYALLNNAMENAAKAVEEVINNRDTAVCLGEEHENAFRKRLEALRESILREDQLRHDTFSLVDTVAMNMDFNLLLEDMLPKIIDITGSNCGAFYLSNQSTNRLEIKYSVGFSKNIYSEFDISLGEGLVGEIARQGEIKVVKDIPEDTVYIHRTFLGNIKPRSLLVIPIMNKEELTGTLVLSAVKDYSADDLYKADLIKYYMGIAVNNGIIYETNKRLANELMFQNKLIQDFNSELEKKVSERTLLFNNIINSIMDYAIYSMDDTGVIQTWNTGAEELMGYDATEVVGQHVTCTYTESEIAEGTADRRLRTVLEEGSYHEMVWRNKKNGARYFADVSIYSIKNNAGDLVGFTNVTRDITGIMSMEKAVRAERAFSYSLLSYIPQPVLITDAAGMIKHMNRLAEYFFGISLKEDEGLRILFSSLFPEKKKVQASFSKAMNSMTRIDIMDVKTTQETYVDVSITTIQEELSDIAAMVVVRPHEQGV